MKIIIILLIIILFLKFYKDSMLKENFTTKEIKNLKCKIIPDKKSDKKRSNNSNIDLSNSKKNRLRRVKKMNYVQNNSIKSTENIKYYNRPFDPNKRLEKTRRPNNYDFINKDNVEPIIRLSAEKKSGYRNIKPGKNLFYAYGYSYMPPEVWSVPQDRPPVCIPQKGFKAEAVPIYTTGTPLDALEIQQSLMPKFKYEEVYDPKYYYPGWKTK